MRVLPGLLSRGMEGVERGMVTKLGGLENRLAKELLQGALYDSYGEFFIVKEDGEEQAGVAGGGGGGHLGEEQ